MGPIVILAAAAQLAAIALIVKTLVNMVIRK